MGEAILSKYGGMMLNIAGYIPKTELITDSTVWKVPKAKGQQFAIRIFGGGGGWNAKYGAGGGGNMNNGIFTLNENESINIEIGAKGSGDHNGGTTSFGTYLSATGGEKGSYDSNGGNGGTGGGGSTHGSVGGSSFMGHGRGGHGFYGGGGGAVFNIYNTNNNINSTQYYFTTGGNGGIYGGGGGGGIGGISTGGYGNGGSVDVNAGDGFNTIGKGLDFEGEGKPGNGIIRRWWDDRYGYRIRIDNDSNKYCVGGGGYGGNGGYCAVDSNNYSNKYISYGIVAGGGGGGYGSRGGNANYGVGGGGGGYGGNGGDGFLQNINSSMFGVGGGGGGYGLEGYGRGAGIAYATYYKNTGIDIDSKSGICIISYMQAIQS